MSEFEGQGVLVSRSRLPNSTRLKPATAHQGLIHEVYAWCVGMAQARTPNSMKMWPHHTEGIAAMAEHIRARAS